MPVDEEEEKQKETTILWRCLMTSALKVNSNERHLLVGHKSPNKEQIRYKASLVINHKQEDQVINKEVSHKAGLQMQLIIHRASIICTRIVKRN